MWSHNFRISLSQLYSMILKVKFVNQDVYQVTDDHWTSTSKWTLATAFMLVIPWLNLATRT